MYVTVVWGHHPELLLGSLCVVTAGRGQLLGSRFLAGARIILEGKTSRCALGLTLGLPWGLVCPFYGGSDTLGHVVCFGLIVLTGGRALGETAGLSPGPEMEKSSKQKMKFSLAF